MDENTIPITRPTSQHSYIPNDVRVAMTNDPNIKHTSIPQSEKTDKTGETDGIPNEFVNRTTYPTETVDLTSEGHFYPQNHPLSSGKIELKMMTAKEEDILTSKSLLKKGTVLTKLLESLIVNKKIRTDDILNCDTNGLYVAIRRLAYGDSYGPVKVKCPLCEKETPTTFDLSTLKFLPFDFSKYPKHKNSFTFQFPVCKKVVVYKILTQKEVEIVEQEIKALQNANKDRSTEITTRLKYTIQAIDGDDDKETIRQFVDSLSSKDSFALRKHIKENTPDMDLMCDFSCDDCGETSKIDFPMTVQFFWPSS